MAYKTIGDLRFAFKAAERKYAMQVVATNDAEGNAQNEAHYMAEMIKQRLAAARNAAKAGRFSAAMVFLSAGGNSEGEE